jgi:hypothetical protein
VKGIANTMLPGGVLHEQREQYGAVLDDLASSASALAKAKAALAQHDAAKPNERSADALAEALRERTAQEKGREAFWDYWNHVEYGPPIRVTGNDGWRIWAQACAWFAAQTDAALAQHDAAKAEPASGAQGEDSARLDALLVILGIDMGLTMDGKHLFAAEDFIDTIKWEREGGTDECPEVRRAFREAIDAARAAQGEEGGR